MAIATQSQHRETFIALRARREAYRVATDLTNKPIDLQSLGCPRCGRELPLREFDRADDARVDCACGALVKLPAHLACYLPAYASLICVACGARLNTTRISRRGVARCDACGAESVIPPEVMPSTQYVPEYDDFVLTQFCEPSRPNPTQLSESLWLAGTCIVLILLIFWVLSLF